jgi:hypothetical protein
MNRFIIDVEPDAIAQQLCDKHIVKMPLEEAQMLCTVLHLHAPGFAKQRELYRAVHKNHPCTKWAGETRANYRWAWRLYDAMLKEYTFRYGKEHGAGKHRLLLKHANVLVPKGPLTQHPQCFSGHDDLKTDEFWPVNAYRGFYKRDKIRFAKYKEREIPHWLKEQVHG